MGGDQAEPSGDLPATSAGEQPGPLDVDPGIDDGPAGETYTIRLISKLEIPGYLVKFIPGNAPYDLVEQERVTG